MYLKEIGVNMKNCIDLVQDGDYWRILVNMSSEHLDPITYGVS